MAIKKDLGWIIRIKESHLPLFTQLKPSRRTISRVKSPSTRSVIIFIVRLKWRVNSIFYWHHLEQTLRQQHHHLLLTALFAVVCVVAGLNTDESLGGMRTNVVVDHSRVARTEHGLYVNTVLQLIGRLWEYSFIAVVVFGTMLRNVIRNTTRKRD